MATISNLTLSIAGSVQPGESIATVEYDINFTPFERDANWAMVEKIQFIGDDTTDTEFGVDDPLIPSILVPWQGNIRPSDIAPGETVLHRRHERTFDNAVLDEDPAINNPDEIRALVTLTPVIPQVVGPIESDWVELAFP